MAELKPCPFCEGKELFTSANLTVHWVKCEKCSAEGPTAETKKEALKLWNTRKE